MKNLIIILFSILLLACSQEQKQPPQLVSKKIKVLYTDGSSEILNVKFVERQNENCAEALYIRVYKQGDPSLESWCECYIDGTHFKGLSFTTIATGVRRYSIVSN